MATTPDPQQEKKEHPSTYVVKDRSNELELIRIDEQDQMITTVMGGVLPEMSDPASLQRVLDVGCGSGRWLIEVAKAYPDIKELVGVDISTRMVEFAQARAEAAGVSDRTTFQTGDALRMLEFPSDYFNLVNQRFGVGYLRTWDWPKLLSEYRRVCQPGGVIRITEGSLARQTNSPALVRLMTLLEEAFYRAGNFFSSGTNGIIDHLADTMTRYGVAQVQTNETVVAYHSNPQLLQWFRDDMTRVFQVIVPFLRKWTKVPDNYDEIYQQMLKEMQEDGFEAVYVLVTAWGVET